MTFTKLGKSDEPYMCVYCMLKAQNHKIQQLITTVKSLTDKLATLLLKHIRSQHPDHELHLPPISLEPPNSTSNTSNHLVLILNQSKTSHLPSIYNHVSKPALGHTYLKSCCSDPTD